MHEVVKRLKTIISQSNATIYQQQNNNVIDDRLTINSIEASSASSHGELSRMINNFHSINTNEEPNNIGLIYNISQGQREKFVPDTPVDYTNLYTGKHFI